MPTEEQITEAVKMTQAYFARPEVQSAIEEALNAPLPQPAEAQHDRRAIAVEVAKFKHMLRNNPETPAEFKDGSHLFYQLERLVSALDKPAPKPARRSPKHFAVATPDKVSGRAYLTEYGWSQRKTGAEKHTRKTALKLMQEYGQHFKTFVIDLDDPTETPIYS